MSVPTVIPVSGLSILGGPCVLPSSVSHCTQDKNFSLPRGILSLIGLPFSGGKTVWKHFATWWNAEAVFQEKLTSLNKSMTSTLSEEEQNTIVSIIEFLGKKGHNTKLGVQFKEMMGKLFCTNEEKKGETTKNLEEILNKLLMKGLEKGKPELFTLCFNYLSLEQVKSLVKAKKGEIENIQTWVQQIAQHLPSPESSTDHYDSEAHRTAAVLFTFLPNILNTFLKVFSLFEEGKEPEGWWEPYLFLDICFKFLLLPYLLITELKVLLIEAWKAYVVGGAFILALMAALYSYLRWLRPCPDKLPYCKNLVHEAKFRRLDVVMAREKKIQEVIASLGPLQKGFSRNPLLVGPSGAGKTKIVEGLAQKIADGNVPDCLKGKKIFLINTASLTGGYLGYADKLEQILSRIRGYENEVIFFFDEIHNAMKKFSQTNLSEFLKPFLDHGIHCIAATTEKDFETFMKSDSGDKSAGDSQAFLERFKKISVESACEEETKAILLKRAANIKDLLVSSEMVQTLIEKTGKVKEAIQPRKADNIFKEAVNKIRLGLDPQYTPPKISQMQAEYENLQRTYALSSSGVLTEPSEQKKLRDKQQEIQQLKKELEEEKASCQITQRWLVFLHDQKEEFFNRTRKLNGLNEKGRKYKKKTIEESQKMALASCCFLIPVLEQAIETNLSRHKQIKVKIDGEFIDQLLTSSSF